MYERSSPVNNMRSRCIVQFVDIKFSGIQYKKVQIKEYLQNDVPVGELKVEPAE